MQRVDVTMAVENLVKPLVESEKMELVDVEYRKEGKAWYLRIFIDKDGGVKIDDCQNISYQIEKLLDVEDIIPHSYTLEVSSPGIERPLKKLKDYERFREKLAKIYLYSPVNNKKNLVGKIIDVEGDAISIEEKDGKEIIKVNYKDISKANLMFEF
ncbi:MAG TPA: ribosome maturation factor RimP [Nitrospinae bacterium]|nr:ribosome maturation factor RimP [Nitrospinota bacterium]HBA26089.1 ribosome maturation factor RimP [Nitrospinota bacterium]